MSQIIKIIVTMKIKIYYFKNVVKIVKMKKEHGIVVADLWNLERALKKQSKEK